MYSDLGRPSIPPEQLLRALLLQALYTVRSERQLMEQIDYNILFRWFIGLNLDDRIWSATTFSKNRERLLQGDIAHAFFLEVVKRAAAADLLSDDHFSVDGTLLEAWAGQKSFTRKDQPRSGPPDDPGNPTVDFRGEKRSNTTHASTTDPDARLAKKASGQEAKLAYHGHLLMENRHGLIVNAQVTIATGLAEREAAIAMLMASVTAGSTVGGDRLFNCGPFVTPVRRLGITPHVAERATGSAIDGRTTRHAGYEVSQRKRKLIEQTFGWLKTIAGLQKLHHRGLALVNWMFTFRVAAYNLVRLRTLGAAL
jgi:transposase